MSNHCKKACSCIFFFDFKYKKLSNQDLNVETIFYTPTTTDCHKS